MSLGKLKTYYEKKLVESYKNEKDFKKVMIEFKKVVLENKNLSKIYSIYDDLSKPQGLNEQDAYEFLKEGITLIQSILPKTKLPKLVIEGKENDYQSIDELVYINNRTIYLNDRLANKKQIVQTLTKPKNEIKESVNIPISSMIKVANQTLKNYMETLDENTKEDLINILKEDVDSLQEKFETIKENTIQKLNELVSVETEQVTVNKINETIEKVKNEQFSQINYLKLKKLNETI
jgi:hypothetical protein